MSVTVRLGEGDGVYLDDHEIHIEEIGVTRLTAFCPICKVQVFGHMSNILDWDLVEHMNQFHKPRKDAGRA